MSVSTLTQLFSWSAQKCQSSSPFILMVQTVTGNMWLCFILTYSAVKCPFVLNNSGNTLPDSISRSKKELKMNHKFPSHYFLYFVLVFFGCIQTCVNNRRQTRGLTGMCVSDQQLLLQLHTSPDMVGRTVRWVAVNWSHNPPDCFCNRSKQCEHIVLHKQIVISGF